MKMPFGKYKGEEICDLPEDYLMWLVSNVDMRQQLKDEVVMVLEDQYNIIVTPDMFLNSATGEKGAKPKFDNSSFNNFPSYLNPNSDMRKFLKDIVDKGYKAVAQKIHPDKGGNKEDMQALNDVKDYLYKGFGL